MINWNLETEKTSSLSCHTTKDQRHDHSLSPPSTEFRAWVESSPQMPTAKRIVSMDIDGGEGTSRDAAMETARNTNSLSLSPISSYVLPKSNANLERISARKGKDFSPRHLFKGGSSKQPSESRGRVLSQSIDVSKLLHGKLLFDPEKSEMNKSRNDEIVRHFQCLNLESQHELVPTPNCRRNLKRRALCESPSQLDSNMKRHRLNSKSCTSLALPIPNNIENISTINGHKKANVDEKVDDRCNESIPNNALSDSICYTNLAKHKSDPDARIMSAIHKFDTDPLTVGDCSENHLFPILEVTKRRHPDLKEIEPIVVANLICGNFNEAKERTTILDCRFNYEFEGGHILGAKNVFTEKSMFNYLFSGENAFPKGADSSVNTKHQILIFHCEFSSKRGPEMLRRVRSWDRNINYDNFPLLHYPEMYVIHGGYQAFYKQHVFFCTPRAYQKMSGHNMNFYQATLLFRAMKAVRIETLGSKHGRPNVSDDAAKDKEFNEKSLLSFH